MSTLRVGAIGAAIGATRGTDDAIISAWAFYGADQSAINDSGNVSSLTDTGTGDGTLNFTNAFSAVTYGATAYPGETTANSRCGSVGLKAVDSLQVLNKNASNTAVDPTEGTNVMVLGPLA